MEISLEQLTATPQAFDRRAEPAWWESVPGARQALPGRPLEALCFELKAHRMADDVYLEGSLAGVLELECSRCLARYRQPLREPFRLVLEPAGDRSPADPEAADDLSRYGVCLGDELETGWYRGSQIDLSAFFRELVALTLPVQPLCREECPGLCDRCGAELGKGPCGCPEKRTESPFAVLAQLRGGARGGDD